MKLAPALVGLWILAPGLARAEPLPLRWSPGWDTGITAASALLALAFASPRLEPRTCRLCATDAFDARMRARLVWSDPAAARVTSDVLANGVLPAAVLAHAVLAARAAGAPAQASADVLVISEAAAIAASVEEIAKDAVARRRPEPAGRAGNTSFYSGHTSLAFSLAASAGTVSSLRGYPSAPWVWGGGMTLAAAVGYLRVAGDAHWTTDVLAGAAAGGLVGFAVPFLLHRSRTGASRPRLEVLPAPGGVAVLF